MLGGVIVRDIQTLSVMPTLGAMLGTTQSNAVLERLNMASGGGVIFGQPGDPYADRYAALKEVLINNLNVADKIVQDTRAAVLNTNRMVAIDSIDMMYEPPPCMKLPIVMYEPIRTLLEAGRINGFNIDPRYLPDEDVYGRLVDNGKIMVNKDTDITDMTVNWHWKTTDPTLTDNDISAIETTREWLDNWLYKQLGPEGDRIDPTDPSNRISKKK